MIWVYGTQMDRDRVNELAIKKYDKKINEKGCKKKYDIIGSVRQKDKLNRVA